MGKKVLHSSFFVVLTGKTIGKNTKKRWHSAHYFSTTYRHNAESFDTLEEAEQCLKSLNKKVAWIEEVKN